MKSVFAKYQSKNYPYRFTATLHVDTIVGGTPSNDRVAEAWLKTKLADADDLIREAVAEVMVERGLTVDEATKVVDTLKHLNGFKRDETGLYVEGRQLKACIKEAVNVAVAVGKIDGRGWGKTNKGSKSFVAEHIFVVEDRLHLGVTEPTGVAQRFIHTFRGSGIQYEEFVSDAKITATVETDFEFSDDFWAAVWLTAEHQGLGASRSQGFGRFTVTDWVKT